MRQHLPLSRRSLLRGSAATLSAVLLSTKRAKAQFAIYDTPAVECVSSTPTTITLRITAGSNPVRTVGAPNGFRISWPSGAMPTCTATVSGSYAAGQSVLVQVGAPQANVVYDPADCVHGLDCGATISFDVVAVGDASIATSHPATVTCSTQPCTTGCTFTQGYWKNHPNSWPVSTLQLGSVSYSKQQLLTILKTPVAGNGLISLAHQLIAAKLNVAAGAGCAAVQTAIQQADALIGSLIVPPIGSGSLAPRQVSSLVTTLDNFNNGVLPDCSGHCG